MQKERYLHHWHSELEICYCLQNGFTHYMDGKEYTSAPGKLFIVNSESIHHIVKASYSEKDDPEEIAVILLVQQEYLKKHIPNFEQIYFLPEGVADPLALSAMLQLAKYAVDDDETYDRHLPVSRRKNESSRICQKSKSNIATKYRHHPGSLANWEIMEQESLVLQVLALLLRDRTASREAVVPIKSGENLERLKQILSHVERHYQEPLSAGRVAGYFHLSQSYFSSFFRRMMHTTFTNYLSEYRAKMARIDLLESSLSICDVAVKNGFPDARGLIQTFKKVYGITPLQYRKNSKKV